MDNSKKFRIVFMGTSSFAQIILQKLLGSNYEISAVYTASDKKTDDAQSNQVKILAENNKLLIKQPKNLDQIDAEELKKLRPDILIVAAYGKILTKEFLNIPVFGALNIHPSLLPNYRGASPIQNAILEGNEEIGTTIIKMNEAVDAGEIVAQKKIMIGPDEIYPEILKKTAEISGDLLLETLPLWLEKKIEPKTQDENLANYCQLIEREDGHIIWSNSALSIYNRWRALNPWPGIFSFWERKERNLRLKLCKISIVSQINENFRIGEVFKSGENIAVKAGENNIIIEIIQLEGKPETSINDFLNGYPDFVGSILK